MSIGFRNIVVGSVGLVELHIFKHENPEDAVVCENCGASRDDDTGDSMDNKDSEDLFFDDEGL